MFKYIDLIIVDEIDRLKVQHLEQLRAIYDEHNLAMIFIGMRGIEKKTISLSSTIFAYRFCT